MDQPHVIKIVHGPGPKRGRRAVFYRGTVHRGLVLDIEGKPARLLHCCDRRGHKTHNGRGGDTRTEAWSFTRDIEGPLDKAKPEVELPGGTNDPITRNMRRAKRMTARMPKPIRDVIEGGAS